MQNHNMFGFNPNNNNRNNNNNLNNNNNNNNSNNNGNNNGMNNNNMGYNNNNNNNGFNMDNNGVTMQSWDVSQQIFNQMLGNNNSAGIMANNIPQILGGFLKDPNNNNNNNNNRRMGRNRNNSRNRSNSNGMNNNNNNNNNNNEIEHPEVQDINELTERLKREIDNASKKWDNIVNNDELFSQIDKPLREALLLPKHNDEVKKYETEIYCWLIVPEKSKSFEVPLSSFSRLILHRLADLFHLKHTVERVQNTHNNHDNNDDYSKTIVYYKTNNTTMYVYII